jgi:hypothetical protein
MPPMAALATQGFNRVNPVNSANTRPCEAGIKSDSRLAMKVGDIYWKFRIVCCGLSRQSCFFLWDSLNCHCCPGSPDFSRLCLFPLLLILTQIALNSNDSGGIISAVLSLRLGFATFSNFFPEISPIFSGITPHFLV